MKTSGTAIAFFFLNLSLNSSTDVWAKLRNSGEEHRELNHKSTNYFQSKLKNDKSGKCLGFRIANDVDAGEKAEWVNCKRAPTFEYQNPQFEDKYYDRKDIEDKNDPYSGKVFHLTFIVGSLSDSSSTSDFRSYMCLKGDKKKGITAEYCTSKNDQYWTAIAVRGKRDTWRFKNSDNKGMIEYIEEEDDFVPGFNLFEIDEILFNFFADAKQALPPYDNDDNDDNNDNYNRALQNTKKQNKRALQNTKEQKNRALQNTKKQANRAMQTAINSVNPRSVFSEPAQPMQLVTTPVKGITEDSVKLSSNVEALSELLRDGDDHDDEEEEEEDVFVKMTSVVSNNGTIFEYFDNAQYFTGLDCRFVYGENPTRDDGWYNGVDPTSTKPPQETN